MNKKVFLTIGILLIVILFCGCGEVEDISDKIQQNISANDEVPVTTSNSDTRPSEEVIHQDAQQALLTKNPYVVLIGIDTVKSITNDNEFQITIQMNVETKYADCIYITDMTYMKYDQGWFLNDLDWVSEDWIQVRIPDADTMESYAGSYLLEHDLYVNAWFADYMLPMNDVTVDYTYNEKINGDALLLSWTAVADKQFYDAFYEFTSLWEYNWEIDNWTLIPNNDQGSLGYHITETSLSNIPHKSVNLNGSWTQGNNPLLGFPQFIFSDFSWDGFNLKITGFIESPERFEHTEVIPAIDYANLYCDLVFTNNTGCYITFKFSDHQIAVSYFDGGKIPVAGVEINKRLLKNDTN